MLLSYYHAKQNCFNSWWEFCNIWCIAHLQFPSTFSNADDYGWKLSEGTYSFHWFNGNAMPTTINEIVIENLNNEETEQQDNDEPNGDEGN